jgi:hypothetical protein
MTGENVLNKAVASKQIRANFRGMKTKMRINRDLGDEQG